MAKRPIGREKYSGDASSGVKRRVTQVLEQNGVNEYYVAPIDNKGRRANRGRPVGGDENGWMPNGPGHSNWNPGEVIALHEAWDHANNETSHHSGSWKNGKKGRMKDRSGKF